ncbi:hypothetical protein [Alkalihalobacterium bogoriense]|uniref:hypothetical protein n=1 Tax=Alkalihalobacterium bogoriense TaxID=246272 RepID=UPI00047B20B2|nr:hypothetical protein [Alkalihalobacterium bogoriense]
MSTKQQIFYNKVPIELQQENRWLTLIEADQTLVPYTSKGGAVLKKFNQSMFWKSYNEAITTIGHSTSSLIYKGVGYVITENDKYVLITIKDAVQNGSIKEQYVEVLDKFKGKAYVEVSHDGNDIHLICIAKEGVEEFSTQDISVQTKDCYFRFTQNTPLNGFCDLKSDCSHEIATLKQWYSELDTTTPLPVQTDQENVTSTDTDIVLSDTFLKNCASESYFLQLKEQIFNRTLWDPSRFMVFNHEASSGKTRWGLAYLAELVMTTDARVLFVQKFAKELADEAGALKKTAQEINRYSKKKIAGYINSKMNQKHHKEVDEILKLPILVITHKMYQQICRGLHSNFIKDRDVLIIDEFPHLVERLSVSFRDFGTIWSNAHLFKNQAEIESMAYDLKMLLQSYQDEKNYKTKIPLIRFNKEKHLEYQALIKDCLQSAPNNPKLKTSLENLLHIIENGCMYYQSGFHTFNHDIEYKLLKNNIILDANAEFEKRYELSPLFHVVLQPKYYDYSSSTFYYYKGNTSKTSLSKKKKFFETVLNRLDLNHKEKTLFITDKERKADYEIQLAMEYTDEPVKVNQKPKLGFVELENHSAVDYFGNLVGVNTYKDYQHAVILKTPYFDFPSYVLDYLFFKGEGIKDGELFSADDFTKVRDSIVAGEIYQALKRVNRSNRLNSNFIVFMNNENVLQMLVNQFPNIQLIRDEIQVQREKKKRTNTNKEKAKAVLLQKKKEGREEIRKKEVRDKLGIYCASNFKKILNELEQEGFFKENQIKCPDKGQMIYFVGDLLQQSS